MKQMGFTHESTCNESQEWYTPPEIFKALGLEFDMDVASPGAAAMPWIPAREHLTIIENGLIHPWNGKIWLNPPYGSDTPEWIARFCNYEGEGIMLVFARTDTKWFHKYAVKCDAFCFVEGRVKFIRGDGYCGGGCGAASLLIAKGQSCADALRDCGLGYFIDLRLNRTGIENTESRYQSEDAAKIKAPVSDDNGAIPPLFPRRTNP